MKEPSTNQPGARNKAALKMALFFSHGVSLAAWDREGLFDREVGYYQNLTREVGEVLFYTYDRPGDGLKGFLSRLAPIKAIYNRWNLPYRLFGILGPFLHYREFKKCQLFKTNQLSGAWTAAIAKWLFKKPLVVRCGYIGSRNLKRSGATRKRLFLNIMMEKLSLRAADMIFVATIDDRLYLLHNYRIMPEKIRTVPNPIDIDQFLPSPERSKQQGLVVFVGRLSPEKNLDLLITACKQLREARLLIIGRGALEDELKALAEGGNIEFPGLVPNNELPALLNQAQVFVLPSKWEGSPKALLEAMACGLAVLGTDVPGIREIIRHGENGLLCEPKAEALAEAIARLLADADLRRRLGAQARKYVLHHNSLSRVVPKEAVLLRSLVSGRSCSSDRKRV